MTLLWEAYIILGQIVLVLGVLLYFPLIYLARRVRDKQEFSRRERDKQEFRENPNSNAGMEGPKAGFTFNSETPNSKAVVNVTFAGFIFFSVSVAVMLGCLIYGELAPDSELGQIEKTRSGSRMIALAVGVVFAMLAKILNLTGIMLVEKKVAGPRDY